MCQFVGQGETHAARIVGGVEDDEPTATVAQHTTAHAGMRRLLDHDDVAVVDARQAVDHGDWRDWVSDGQLGREPSQRLHNALDVARPPRRGMAAARWPATTINLPSVRPVGVPSRDGHG